MQNKSELIQKLEAFIRKYHMNDILRGAILFLSIGLLYLLLLLLIEYFFWLPTIGRKVLFWSIIVVELALLYRWILIPLSKLLKLREGLSYEKAARIIGSHFPEVSDKLLNTLQLQQSGESSELLFASIEQKMDEMKTISFPKAVSFASNKKYLPYFVLPILVFVLSFFIADANWFGSSYNRVANYNVAYTPPAPYSFHILNDSLTVVQNEPFDLAFTIIGNRIPEEVKLEIGEESYFLQEDDKGVYRYSIASNIADLPFAIIGNNKVREEFVLKVLPRPFIQNMELSIQPPAHTRIKPSKMRGSGAAEVPEGSKVTWNIETSQSDRLRMVLQDSVYNFNFEKDFYVYTQQILQPFDYSLEAVNNQSNQKETMHFRMQIIKDAYPTINVQQKQDDIEPTLYQFSGSAEDDYGLRSLIFVIYPSANPAAKEIFDIPLSGNSFEEFQFNFDTREYIQEQGNYVYYFEVSDNDAVNSYKITRSDMGTIEALSSDAIKDSQLDFQKDKLQNLSENMQKWMEENADLEELENLERTDENLRWEDIQKMNAFRKQEQYSLESLEKITEDLKESLDKMEASPSSQEEKEQLQERMDEQLQELAKNQELLDKLEELQSKISNEELVKEIEEYKQEKKIQEKNLNQLLELTKRFYVSEKNKKLAADLMELGKKQEELSEKDGEEVKAEQEKLQEQFDRFKDEMDNLMKENQELLKPFSLHQDKSTEERISEDQQEALDKLEEGSTEESKPSQQGAGQKMQQLAEAMQQQQMQGGMESIAEDAAVLRQILDNLVRFSFSQEELLDVFKQIAFSNPNYGNHLTSQHDLKQNFRHVNDSLFALSLRQPSMGRQIHQLTTEINDHIDVALDDLAQNRMPNGITQQQYALSGANELAVMLSDILENMQMQMQSSSGQGEGSDFQLSDIIEQQESLMDGEGEDEGEAGDNEGDQGDGEDGSEGDVPSGEQSGSSEGGDNGNQQGEGDSYMDMEGEDGSFYEIYKQQQQLKMQLEDYLLQHGLDGKEAQSILEEMDAVSLKLLEQGSSDSSRRQMQQILHKLLELEKAALQQEEDEERKANTNLNNFPGSMSELQLTPKEKLPATEVLNRESLHLTPYFRRKVQEYFN
ncbi:MAG TPA: hypothetical protein VK050_03775 [Flavobacteriaceae bacterium]|nr:hypothetical protein [Flavobacteriaceae bacterium]